MGKSMIRHLLKKYNVVVYNRTKERALDLLEEGASWADTPTEVANLADVVLTIVGYPKVWKSLLWGPRDFQVYERASRGGGSYNKYTNVS